MKRTVYVLTPKGENILEKMGRNAEALDAYQEAQKLYPELDALKKRVALLEGQLNGEVL